MRTYTVKKIQKDFAGAGDALWQQAEAAQIDTCPWPAFSYCPDTWVRLLWSDAGVSVLFQTDEQPIGALRVGNNSDVCNDSCMEFFFSADESSSKYMNIEVNPLTTMLVGTGTGRPDICFQEFDANDFRISSILTPKTWTLSYFIAFSFLRRHFSEISPVWRANFYKCGNVNVHRHFVCWNEITTPEPEFHSPQCFGRVVFSGMDQ